METETNVWEKCFHDLTYTTNTMSSDTQFSCLKALSSARALIINHSTADEIISRVLETLVQFLQHHQNPLNHHVLTLLSDLAIHRNLSPVVFDKVYAYVSVRKDASPLTAKALAVLITTAERCQRLSTSSNGFELSEDFFLLLCLSPSVSVREWVLLNTRKFHVCPSRLVTVLLELTTDPYPYVRRAALDVLVSLKELTNVEKGGLVERCYARAVELLLDTNECVRSVAVRVVSKWGHTLTKLDPEDVNMNLFDGLFVQLCSVVRDMSVEVRIEAFSALGKMKLVSEDLLLQTLSKKITKVMKGKMIVGSCTSKTFDLPASNAAGVFVHGLEDEFNEVRKSAIISLGKLTILSIKFAEAALNLLMDMLNDDIMAVRLQCLETMFNMATSDCLQLQQTHMHMFLGTLVDSNTLIRNTTRKILRLMKLTDLDIFNSVTNGLLTNLESYPGDESDIFNVLFHTGKSHGNFSVSFVMEILPKVDIEPSYEGELHFDRVSVAAILVLAMGASLAHERVCSIPVKLFTYSIPFLGRISRSVKDVLSQDTLFAYLSHWSRSLHSPLKIFGAEEHCFNDREDVSNHDNKDTINKVVPLLQISYATSENMCPDSRWEPLNTMPVLEYQQKLPYMQKEETDVIIIVLRTVADTWPLIKLGCSDEVRRTLRSCKEELAIISVGSNESDGLLAFACQYVRIIRLLAKAWEYFSPQSKFDSIRTASLDLILEKLEMNLRRMKYGFLGVGIEVAFHILELMLLTCVLRLSKAEICCRLSTLKRLRSTISCVDLLCEKGFTKVSDFARELKLFFQEESSDVSSHYSFHLKQLHELFSLKQVLFTKEVKLIKAELDVQGNDSEKPLPFISGLPAAITFQITVHNVSTEDRLWLMMSVEELTQYVFLDFEQFEDCDGFRRVILNVPFYRTPKAVSFSLKACIGKECPSEDVQSAKGVGGPKRELTFLCSDKEFFFLRRV